MAQKARMKAERQEDKRREDILKRATEVSVYNPIKSIDELIKQRKQNWDRMLQEEGHKFEEDD